VLHVGRLGPPRRTRLLPAKPVSQPHGGLSPGAALLLRECSRGARDLYLLGERMPERADFTRVRRTCEEQQ
jgi:hypothetical protein